MKKWIAAAMALTVAASCTGMNAYAETFSVSETEQTELITDLSTISSMLKTYIEENAFPVKNVTTSRNAGYVTVLCTESNGATQAALLQYLDAQQIDQSKVLLSYDGSVQAEKTAVKLLPYIAENNLPVTGCDLYSMPGFFAVYCSNEDYEAVHTALNGVIAESSLEFPRLRVICPADANPPLPGDVDGSGAVDASDAQLVLNYVLDVMLENETEPLNGADIDSSGEINSVDAQYILLYYLENVVLEKPTVWKELLPENAKQPAYASDTAYRDENISISLTSYYDFVTTEYVMDIQVSDVKYLKAAFAQNTYGNGILAPTSEIAEENNAILAINGDYYNYHTYGYVVRNGVAYRDLNNGSWLGCLFLDGDLRIISSNNVRAASLVEDGCWQEWCFGPPLLNDGGQIVVGENDEVGQSMSSNPRTALGMIEPLHYQFVVSDGRSTGNAGLSLYQLAQFMQPFNTQVLYNLDGGGSSCMWFLGSIINQPINVGRIQERNVSDIVYLGY